MILDAGPECLKATFDIGGGSTTREWDIRVTQYSCGSNDGGLLTLQLLLTLLIKYNVGPDGCLQYFTGTTGTIASFNFPTTATTVSSTGFY